MQYKGELKYPATQITTQMPPHLAKVEGQVTPVRFLFSGEGGSQRDECTDPEAGISPCAKRMGNTPTRHTSTKNIQVKTYMLDVNHQ